MKKDSRLERAGAQVTQSRDRFQRQFSLFPVSTHQLAEILSGSDCTVLHLIVSHNLSKKMSVLPYGINIRVLACLSKNISRTIKIVGRQRTPSHPTKSHVVVAKEGDKVKTIRFGQQGVSGAGKNPKTASEKARRKSFKARHAKNIAKGKMSAAYWADKVKWMLLVGAISGTEIMHTGS